MDIECNAPYEVIKGVNETTFLVDSSGGPVSVTLDSPVNENGHAYIIKDKSGEAATNNITVTAPEYEDMTID